MAGYTRQATANIQTGKVIYAEDLNAEYNALAAAFSGSTGHSHDGSTGNGPKINLVNSVEGVLPLAMGGTGASNASGARTAIGAHNASNLTAGTLPNARLSGSYSFGSLTLSGELDVSGVATMLGAEMTAQTGIVLASGGQQLNRYRLRANINDDNDYGFRIDRWNGESYDMLHRVEGSFTAIYHRLEVDGRLDVSGTINGDGSGLTNLNASAVSTGTLPANRLPNHSAALLTSGTLPSGRLSGNYSFGSLTLSGNLNLTSGNISGDAANIMTNPGGWAVRTENNSSAYILSVQSSGGGERFKVVHGAPLMQGNSSGWSVDGAFTATTISGTLSGNGSGITNLNASNVSSGTLNASRIPNLNASKVTAGAFHVDRIPALPASKVTSGTFAADRIPSLNASILGSGTVPAARLSGNYSFGSLTLSGDLNVSGAATLNSLYLASGGSVNTIRSNNAYLDFAPDGNNGQATSRFFRASPEGLTYTVGFHDGTAGTWLRLSSNDGVTLSTGSFSGNGSGITNLNASNVSSGTLPAARLPNHSANLLTSGTLPNARLSGNYSFGSLSLSGNLTTQGPIVADASGGVSRVEIGGSANILDSSSYTTIRGRSGNSTWYINTNNLPNGWEWRTHDNGNGYNNAASLTAAGVFSATRFSGNGSTLTNLNGSNVSSGTVASARIANLPASKVTSGTFHINRIPDIPASKLPSTNIVVHTGSSSGTTSFPIGHTVLVRGGRGTRNGAVTVRIDSGNSNDYVVDGSGSTLAGTWRHRGGGPSSLGMAQRVA